MGWQRDSDSFLLEILMSERQRDGTFPGVTIRVPRGVIFHGFVTGKGQTPIDSLARHRAFGHERWSRAHFHGGRPLYLSVAA